MDFDPVRDTPGSIGLLNSRQGQSLSVGEAVSGCSPSLVIKRLVLIDDDNNDEYIFRRAVRLAGITSRVIHLSGGKAAIDYFAGAGNFQAVPREPRAELVFLDINMPGTSGFDVLESIKDCPPDRRPLVAMLTSWNFAEDRKTAFDLGADGRVGRSLLTALPSKGSCLLYRPDYYLVKPVTIDLLAEFASSHGMQWATARG